MVAGHTPGDIVTARDGSKWCVIAVERTVVRAEHIATGVVSHFDHGTDRRAALNHRARTAKAVRHG